MIRTYKIGSLLLWTAKITCFMVAMFLVMDFLFPFRFKIEHSTIIKDRNGETLHCYLSKDEQWRFPFEEEDLDPELIKAILQKEDKYFYHHPGINPVSMVRALINNTVYNKKTSGASTITMQVCRMLDRKPRTYGNKLIEIWNALQMEWHYSKKEILMTYLTLLPYGGNIQGVKSASIIYFQKKPKTLSTAQIAALCIIPNRPNSLRFGKNDVLLKKERNKWVRRFYKEGIINKEAMEDALNEPVKTYRKIIPRKVPHFSQRMKNKTKESIVNTFLDMQIQDHLERIAVDHIRDKKKLNINNASIIVIDNKTREVVGYLGSSNFFDTENAGQVDGVRAIRSPGSTLKPFLYAMAFDKGLYTPKSIINDIPVNFSGYEPQNFNEKFNGKITISSALARSLNVPAVRLLNEVGTEKFIDKLSDIGFRKIRYDKHKLGFSVILGGCGVRLEELGNLFCTLANHGEYKPLIWHKNGYNNSEKKQVLSPGAAYLTTNILTKITRPDMPNKIENNVNLPKLAWKTGTSYGRRDAWSVGYNTKYTVGVWVGNFSGEGVAELSGAEIATPLLFKVFNAIQYKTSEEWFTETKDLDFRYVCSQSGKIPNDECKHQVIDYYLPKKSPNDKCRHYKYVLVNRKETESYCTRCCPEQGYKEKKYPWHDDELMSYFDLQHIDYIKTPAHNSSCARIFKENAPTIVSPEKEVEYVLFKEEKQKIILKSTAANDVKNVYWFVNDQFVGRYKKGSDTYFSPTKEGEYRISCSDDKGRNSKLKIKVRFI